MIPDMEPPMRGVYLCDIASSPRLAEVQHRTPDDWQEIERRIALYRARDERGLDIFTGAYRGRVLGWGERSAEPVGEARGVVHPPCGTDRWRDYRKRDGTRYRTCVTCANARARAYSKLHYRRKTPNPAQPSQGHTGSGETSQNVAV